MTKIHEMTQLLKPEVRYFPISCIFFAGKIINFKLFCNLNCFNTDFHIPFI